MSALFSRPEWGQWLIYLHFGNESSLSAPLPAFSTAWTPLFKLLFSVKVPQIPLLLWYKQHMSWVIQYNCLEINYCEMFCVQSSRSLFSIVQLENRNHLCSQELTLCVMLGSLMPWHNAHYLPALECTCGVWELQIGWTAVLSVTHWTCQVKTDKPFSSHLLTCNETTY